MSRVFKLICVTKSHLIVCVGNTGKKLFDAFEPYYQETTEIIGYPIMIDSKGPESKKLLRENIEEETKNIFFFAGLGGELGGTITLDLARVAKYNGIPSFVIGVLPASRRSDPTSLDRASRAITELNKLVKGVIIIDNEKISHLPYFENYYERYNEYVASILADIFEASSNEAVLDSLSVEGGAGYASVARASELTKGILGYVIPIFPHRELDIRTLLRVALEKLTVFDDPIGSVKGAAIISVPERYINTIDQGLIEDLMEKFTETSTIDVYATERNIASITTIFTYRFEQFKSLRRI